MKIKVLYTIPNFDTAGSGIVLYKLLTVIDKGIFEPEVVCLHDKGELFKKVLSLGFQVHVFQYTHPMRPVIGGMIHCWKVSRFFRSRKYDIIYSFHYHADYSEPIAAKLAGAKWIFVKKNMGWFGPNIRAWKLRSFLADKIILQNTDMAKEFYTHSKKTQLISIGVDTREFYPRNKDYNFKKNQGFNEEDIILLSVSSLLPMKGVEDIIDAFLVLQNEFKILKLVIIGNDKSVYAEYLKSKVKSENLFETKVFFMGVQNNIANWVNIADLSIQATKNEGRREGAPIALQEAMAVGCLVIGSRVSGIKDQLSNFNEFLFEPDNPADMIRKIRYVLSLTNEKRSEYAARMVEEINKRYSLDLEKKLHENMLIRVLQ